jgi:hypothetical protein
MIFLSRLLRLALLVGLVLVVLFLAMRWLSRQLRPRSEHARIGDLIESFLRGTAEPYAWENFCKLPNSDPYLDGIRKRCANLDKEFPPDRPGEFCNADGVRLLRSLAAELRGRRAS